MPHKKIVIFCAVASYTIGPFPLRDVINEIDSEAIGNYKIELPDAPGREPVRASCTLVHRSCLRERKGELASCPEPWQTRGDLGQDRRGSERPSAPPTKQKDIENTAFN